MGFLCLLGAFAFVFVLASYHPSDPSWNTATWVTRPLNKLGRVGAVLADFSYQTFGFPAWLFPPIMTLMGWRWMRNRALEAPFAKAFGYLMLASSVAGLFQLWAPGKPYGGAFEIGGVTGYLLNGWLVDLLNPLGTTLLLIAMGVIALYIVSTFSLARMTEAAEAKWRAWGEERELRRQARLDAEAEIEREPVARRPRRAAAAAAAAAAGYDTVLPIADEVAMLEARAMMAQEPANGHTYSNGYGAHTETPATTAVDTPPWEEDIPILTLEEIEPVPDFPVPEKKKKTETTRTATHYELPRVELLNQPSEKESYDRDELKEIAANIKSKLAEFNVLGNVVQINPGPVVTTYEFKPDAGVKIARITTLSEDLALGLQAESVLIERIPGKPTVAIELPNSHRETIALRQIFESPDFQEAATRLTFALGKDISGRIRVTELEKMPHLLIAGTTGSGKSVMLNALILSVLYRCTPDEVRLILVDPKRVELGIYEGIPHLLTPVIADAKKATNALRNAVLEMERRLKLLASYGVRNIDQFNKKIKQKTAKPLELFPEAAAVLELDDEPLPYIVIVIDELADLMMLERAGVEESIIRLAQMARAVGIHLVLATQRPSVDVITGLIKANLPARISFKLRTRIDSRTVLDVMGAENLLGMGDMLFLPPGTSRLLRVHGPFVTEAEINRVCDFWREQATPEYDSTFLVAPPSDDEGDGPEEEFEGEQDPLYTDAVRIVLEMGKASTSILQRRLRLGYGRAARILDMMQHEGIIGPPDGSRPREVLKRPDWLDQVEATS